MEPFQDLIPEAFRCAPSPSCFLISPIPTTPHHRRSIRLPGYDYTQPGAYFVTICTWQMQCLFGAVVDEEMQLNQIGRIALQQWLKLGQRFPHVDVSTFVIMPNHIHGIIILNDAAGRGAAEPDRINLDETNRSAPTPVNPSPHVIPGSLEAIVRAYKSAVTLRINHLRNSYHPPIWQCNYYEHILRNDADWENVLAYIQYNPARWNEDRFHP